MKRLIKKSTIDESQFDEEQLQEIDKATQDGLNIDKYLNPNINSYQMRYMFEGLRNGYDVTIYDDWEKFSGEQMREIYEGLEFNLDVTLYAKPELSWVRMHYVKLALFNEYPVELFLDENIHDEQMGKLNIKLDNLKDSVAHHDISSRYKALVYFNGKFYEGKTHAECLNKALEEKDRENLHDLYYRPSKDKIKRVTTDEDEMFFAHIVDNPHDTRDYDGTENENSIYIIPDSYLLKGFTVEEAAQTIKNSKEYNDFKVFKDDDSYVDYIKMERVFPRLAKLKKIQILKTLYGEII
jgi:hypothetical protein